MINLINISKILQIPLIFLKIIGISSLANFLLFNLDVTKALFSFYLIGFIKSLIHLNIDRFEADISRILFYCIIASDLAITISILTLSCCFIQVVYQIRQGTAIKTETLTQLHIQSPINGIYYLRMFTHISQSPRVTNLYCCQ